ncbi:MAG TPA: 2-amino-4-hydroxy-6-hydroxymethyldihydropteridine diphosphokinase [Clostridiaceae bacterium]|nr:2-amino-4-hydroxy-6-hydroxymethyldihydropteridine diphosphokinase [Clostridiaceae bacterium]
MEDQTKDICERETIVNNLLAKPKYLITLKGMEFFTHLGVRSEEKEQGQKIIIDLDLSCYYLRGILSDDLEETVNYSAVYDFVKEKAEAARNDLIEYLAGEIADGVFDRFPLVAELSLTIKKPFAPIKGKFDYMAFTLTQSRDNESVAAQGTEGTHALTSVTEVLTDETIADVQELTDSSKMLAEDATSSTDALTSDTKILAEGATGAKSGTKDELSHEVYISLGSNIGDREGHLIYALCRLEDTPGIRLERISSLYETLPWGETQQRDFFNAVAVLHTSLEPLAILDICQAIENERGRTREIKWGARSLDLDLIFYDDLELNSERLTLPHPLYQERDFVLVPLAEIKGANIADTVTTKLVSSNWYSR